MQMRKILVPTDFSPEGERALNEIVELVSSTRSAVLLLHVVENVGVAPSGGQYVAPPVLLPGTEQELALARKQLAERRARFPAAADVTTEAMVGPSVAHTINEHAVSSGCDVIALSSHGRTGFRRLIMGSITEAVLRGARVPVLIFPRQA
jgi:nucleotide-binding universal stress UspA family protein